MKLLPLTLALALIASAQTKPEAKAQEPKFFGTQGSELQREKFLRLQAQRDVITAKAQQAVDKAVAPINAEVEKELGPINTEQNELFTELCKSAHVPEDKIASECKADLNYKNAKGEVVLWVWREEKKEEKKK